MLQKEQLGLALCYGTQAVLRQGVLKAGVCRIIERVKCMHIYSRHLEYACVYTEGTLHMHVCVQ